MARGEIVGVAGHVGAGKSTLALAAAGLLERATRATIAGRVMHPAGGAPPACFVFANPWTQLTELGGTVEEEVAVGPENQALAPDAIRARVDRALARADGGALAPRIPRELSGGELQRVALASALALDAPLVVLDEPTAQLDPEAARRFVNAVRALASNGHGVLLVSQDLALLVSAASRVVVLADGAIVADGRSARVAHARTAARCAAGFGGTPSRARRSGAGAHGDPLLAISGLAAGYGDRDVLRRRHAHGAARRDLGVDGRERCGEEHARAGDHGARAGATRQHRRRAARCSTRCRWSSARGMSGSSSRIRRRNSSSAP